MPRGLPNREALYADAAFTKRDLLDYTYAVLRHPAHRPKYEINLKREFPRLPLYDDFRRWAAWDASLMALHLDYEQAAPFPFERHDAPTDPARLQPDLLPDERLAPKRLLDDKPALKPRFKADKNSGTIEIDAVTTLRGIPAAWTCKLGNRSALEWVLDQWKEHKISDPTVAERFNTYRFAPYKETGHHPPGPRLHGQPGNHADRQRDAGLIPFLSVQPTTTYRLPSPPSVSFFPG